MISATIQKEISFYDLDPMNVVWHGNYVKFLEDARCALLAKINYTYVDMKNENRAYPIAKMNIKFLKPCTFGQKIDITATLKEYESCLIIDYQIVDSLTSEVILKGQTMQICVDVITGKSVYNSSAKLIEGVQKYA